MESRALSDPAFPAFAAKVVPFLHVTTQIKDRKYDGLLKAKGFNGFPSLAIADVGGNVLMRVTDRSVAGFEKALATVIAWISVQQRIDAGEKGLEYDLLVAEWDMGRLNFTTLRSRANALQNLNEAQAQAIAQILINAEVIDLFTSANKKENFEPTAKRFRAILDAGKTMPTGDAEMMFWNLLVRKAEMEPVDIPLLEKALIATERLLQGKPNQDEMLQKMRDRIAELRKAHP